MMSPRVFLWRLRRAWSMLRLYWGTEDCDWSTIAELMRHQIRRTRLHIEACGIAPGVDDDKHCRQMLITEHLLTRILDETYYDIAEARYPEKGKHWAQMISSLEKQDMDMLSKTLNKHLQSWWD